MRRLLPVFLVLVVGLALIGGASTALSQSGNTWRGDYFPNLDWAGAPVMTQYTSLVSFNWGQGSPGPGMPSDNWTARFTTDAFFNGTTYSFTAVADDEVIVTVDGVQYINTVGRNLSGKSVGVTMPMSQGTHRVEVLYREFTVDAYVFVSWSTCSGCTAPPTPGVTYPPLPPNQNPPLVTEFGDYTSCMQTPMHQVNCFVPTWNLNAGSIEMESQIQSWVRCSPADVQATYMVNNQPRSFRCSKTLAGWFPQ